MLKSVLINSFIANTMRELALEIYSVSFTLFKLMIPVIIVVKILEEMGAIPLISKFLEPLMSLVGLPDSMGLVWTTTMLTNIYAGILLFFQLAPQENLSVAQVTVLSGLLLMAHGLPVEVRIAQQAGVRFVTALLIRLVGALFFGLLLHHLYQWGDWLQQPAELLWTPPEVDSSLKAWTLSQLESLLMIILVVTALLSLLRFLRWIHVERLMIWLLKPVLKVLGIGTQATSLTIIGITLGLAFGGGLLIREAQTGRISKRDIFSALCLLALCHSLIEDTLLILLLGADITGALWLRLIFSLVFVAIMTRWLVRTSEDFQNRFLVRSVVVPQVSNSN